MNIYTTRKATLQDIDVLLSFEQGVIYAERPFDTTLKENPIHYYDITQMIFSEEVELLVAVHENKIIGSGYARIEAAKPYLKYKRFAYLGFMYVIPEYRGRGINQIIMNSLESWTASKGITEMRLEVYHENQPAVHAYEKAGFSPLLIQMRKAID
ncbi:MAG: GNAT family N-acetyltransferase [Bacteroidetes bacterium]|nr:GNAT family N-acetyltransferase [Bacteroidota bacterium]